MSYHASISILDKNQTQTELCYYVYKENIFPEVNIVPVFEDDSQLQHQLMDKYFRPVHPQRGIRSLKCVTIKKKTTNTERLRTQNLNKWSIITKIQAIAINTARKMYVIQMTTKAMSKFKNFLPHALMQTFKLCIYFVLFLYVNVLFFLEYICSTIQKVRMK